MTLEPMGENDGVCVEVLPFEGAPTPTGPLLGAVGADRKIAWLANANTLDIFAVVPNARLRRFSFNSEIICASEFILSDKRMIAVSLASGDLQFIDPMKDRKPCTPLRIGKATVVAMNFVDFRVLPGAHDYGLVIYTSTGLLGVLYSDDLCAEGLKCMTSLPSSTGAIATSVYWMPDTSIIAIGFDDGSCILWNNDLELSTEIPSTSRPVSHLFFHRIDESCGYLFVCRGSRAKLSQNALSVKALDSSCSIYELELSESKMTSRLQSEVSFSTTVSEVVSSMVLPSEAEDNLEVGFVLSALSSLQQEVKLSRSIPSANVGQLSLIQLSTKARHQRPVHTRYALNINSDTFRTSPKIQSGWLQRRSSRIVRTSGSALCTLSSVVVTCFTSLGLVSFECNNAAEHVWKHLQYDSPQIFTQAASAFELCEQVGLCSRSALAKFKSFSEHEAILFALMDVVVRLGGAGIVSQYISAVSIEEATSARSYLLPDATVALRWMEAFVDRCERQLRGIMSSGSFASEYREFIKVIEADLKGLMTIANMQLRCRGNATASTRCALIIDRAESLLKPLSTVLWLTAPRESSGSVWQSLQQLWARQNHQRRFFQFLLLQRGRSFDKRHTNSFLTWILEVFRKSGDPLRSESSSSAKDLVLYTLLDLDLENERQKKKSEWAKRYSMSFTLDPKRQYIVHALWHLDQAEAAVNSQCGSKSHVVHALKYLSSAPGNLSDIATTIVQLLLDLGHPLHALRASRMLSARNCKPFIAVFVRALLCNELWQEALAYVHKLYRPADEFASKLVRSIFVWFQEKNRLNLLFRLSLSPPVELELRAHLLQTSPVLLCEYLIVSGRYEDAHRVYELNVVPTSGRHRNLERPLLAYSSTQLPELRLPFALPPLAVSGRKRPLSGQVPSSREPAASPLPLVSPLATPAMSVTATAPGSIIPSVGYTEPAAAQPLLPSEEPSSDSDVKFMGEEFADRDAMMVDAGFSGSAQSGDEGYSVMEEKEQEEEEEDKVDSPDSLPMTDTVAASSTNIMDGSVLRARPTQADVIPQGIEDFPPLAEERHSTVNERDFAAESINAAVSVSDESHGDEVMSVHMSESVDAVATSVSAESQGENVELPVSASVDDAASASDESEGEQVTKSSFASVASNAIVGSSLRGRLLAGRHATIPLEEVNEDEIESPHSVSIPDAVVESSDVVSDPDLRAHARSSQIDSIPSTIEQRLPMANETLPTINGQDSAADDISAVNSASDESRGNQVPAVQVSDAAAPPILEAPQDRILELPPSESVDAVATSASDASVGEDLPKPRPAPAAAAESEAEQQETRSPTTSARPASSAAQEWKLKMKRLLRDQHAEQQRSSTQLAVETVHSDITAVLSPNHALRSRVLQEALSVGAGSVMPASISNESVEVDTKDTESDVVLTRKRKAVRHESPSRKSPRRSGSSLSEDEDDKLLETEPEEITEAPAPPSVDDEEPRKTPEEAIVGGVPEANKQESLDVETVVERPPSPRTEATDAPHEATTPLSESLDELESEEYDAVDDVMQDAFSLAGSDDVELAVQKAAEQAIGQVVDEALQESVVDDNTDMKEPGSAAGSGESLAIAEDAADATSETKVAVQAVKKPRKRKALKSERPIRKSPRRASTRSRSKLVVQEEEAEPVKTRPARKAKKAAEAVKTPRRVLRSSTRKKVDNADDQRQGSSDEAPKTPSRESPGSPSVSPVVGGRSLRNTPARKKAMKSRVQ